MDACVHEAFASHAAKQPEAIAATCAADAITYGALNGHAEAIACALRRSGVRREATVAILLEPSIAVCAAILAVWKAGGAAALLDPGEPIPRVREILRDVAARAILTDTRGAERLSDHDAERLSDHAGNAAIVRIENVPSGALAPRDGDGPSTCASDPDTLAYVTYSPGAAETVHGTMVSHRALGTQVRWMQRTCPPGAQDRVIQSASSASFSSETVVWQICAALMTGGRVIITPPGASHSPAAPVETTVREGVKRFRERLETGLYLAYGATQIYILDERLRPVPQGLAGELYIGGESLARGYWRRPDLTAARFVPHSLARTPGERLYRTGDRARWLADGSVEYLGPLTRQATVTSSRVARGEREGSEATETPYRPPGTEIERQLAEVWQDVLRVDRVGMDDDFFELGGDSIVSIRIVSGAAQHGLKLRVRQIFEHPTIAELARHATSIGATTIRDSADTAPAGGPGDTVPLTPIQSWFFGQRLANPHHFNQAVLVEVTGITLADVEARVAWWLATHAVLRQRWQERDGVWTMTEAATETACVVTCVDLSAVSPESVARELERQAAQVQASLHLTTGPLLRVVLFRRADGVDRLLVVIHHLAVDGVSWRILMEDWQRGPKAAPVPYADWARVVARHAKTPAAEADAAYWLAQAEAPVDIWPVDRPSGANTVACAASVVTTFGVAETQALVQQGPRAPLSASLLAACAHAFSERLGVTRCRVDIEGHGREDEIAGVDVSRTVGWFTTIHPFVLTRASGARVEETRQANSAQLQHVPHHGFTFGLLRHLGARPEWRTRLAAMPPAPVSFNYLGQFNDIAEAGFRVAPESPGPTQSPSAVRAYELQITATIIERSLQVTFGYSRERYHPDTIGGAVTAFHDAVSRLAARSDTFVDAPATPPIESTIVRISDPGPGVPLFCVASYGEAPSFIFRDLARALAHRHQVYGLRVDGEGGHFSFEQCATRHVEAIRRIQPEGPYVLAGYSLGGLVAFETARQLESAGHDASRLILFDTVCPTTQQDVQSIGDSDLLDRILRMRDPELVWPEEILQLPEPQRLAGMYAVAIRRRAVAPRANMDLSETRALLRLWRQRGAYVPRGFSGQILLLRTRDTSILDARFTLPWALAGETERSLGWRLVEGCTLTVVPVPGDHANFLFRPHAAAVAAHVEDWTAQVVGIG